MIAFTCVIANILFIALAYFLRSTGTSVVMLTLAVVATCVVGIVYYNRPKTKIVVANGKLLEEPIIKSHKILTLASETVEQD